MPEGPRYYPEGMVTDVAEAFWVAELVREQLLHRCDDELPHTIACRVTEWEWPRVRCEILVERDSQKGIVIGKGGRDPQGGRHRGARAAAARRLPRALRAGREALAAARGHPRPARLLTRPARLRSIMPSRGDAAEEGHDLGAVDRCRCMGGTRASRAPR